MKKISIAFPAPVKRVSEELRIWTSWRATAKMVSTLPLHENHRNDLTTSSKTTAEYYEIGPDGYITEKKALKKTRSTTTGTTRSVRKKTTAHSASTPTIRKPMVRSWKIW